MSGTPALTIPQRATGPIVIKVGGAMLDSPDGAAPLLQALDAAWSSRRVGGNSSASAPRIVLVHGGGRAVDRQLAKLQMPTERREGIRITPPDQMEQIAGVLAGVVNTALVGMLTARGIPAVGLTLSDGGCCHVELATNYSFDAGRVGDIVGGDNRLLNHLLDGGFLPVMSSIGFDSTGTTLNLNADDAAVAVARIHDASALLLLTDVPGVMGPDGRVVDRLDRAQAEAWITDGTISGGMIVKVRGALAASEAAGPSVRGVIIASWNDPAAIREIVRGGRAGTLFESPLQTLPAMSANAANAANSAKSTKSSSAPSDGALCAKDA